jgi:hypothetical protein
MRLRISDAIRLIEAALVLENGAPDRDAGLRRAGEILEWLSHASLNVSGLPLSLLGAACYQLAGYPARANSLLSVSDENHRDSPLLARLLRADFDGLLRLAVTVSSAPPRSVDERVKGGEVRQAAQASYVTELVVGEMASALGVFAASLRWPGEQRFAAAVDKIRAAAPALLHLVDPFTWLLVRLSAEVAAESGKRSLRAGLEEVLAQSDDPGRSLAFERYTRLAFRNGQALAWPSQQQGFARLAQRGSFALCTPTGSGKTRVAEVALLDGLFRGPNELGLAPLCLYIVPSRALAAEVESKLSRALRNAGGPQAVTVTSLYGGADWGGTEEWISGADPTVLICTQEKAEALIRFLGGLIVSRLSVVIVDEAHSVQFDGDTGDLRRFEARSLRLEVIVASLRSKRPDVQFIAMSAVAQHLERAMGQWIVSDDDARAVTVNYRSTRSVIGRLHCLQGGETRIEYDVLDGQLIARSDDEDYQPTVWQPFPARPEAPLLEGTKRRPATFALWAAASLAASDRGDDQQAVLVSIAEGINDYALWWLALLEEHWKGLMPTFFEEPTDGLDATVWQRALATMRDLFGEQSREYRLLRHGVVVHHGRMPGRLPRLLTELVERGIVRIVVATSSLSEGVNLPVQTVLVPGMYRFSEGRQMSAHEFANLAGRPGRPGVSTEGQTLVLMEGASFARSAARRGYDDTVAAIAQGTESDDVARSPLEALIQELRDKQGATTDDDFVDWLETTAPRNEQASAAVLALDSLDAVLLAALEGSPEGTGEDVLRSFWRGTLARHVARDEERLQRFFTARGAALTRNVYPDLAERTTLYRTGIPPRDATDLLAVLPRLLEHLATGTDYVAWGEEDRFAFVTGAMDLVSEVPKFAVPAFAQGKASAHDVLEWWLKPDAATKAPTVPQISRWHSFLQQQVRYRFTWGLGAAMAVAVEGRVNDGLVASDWLSAGIPWAAVWIKDLLTWGTLDPVAAFVLSRGVVDTRAEASALAATYYAAAAARSAPDPLDINSIRDWLASRDQDLSKGSGRQNRRFDVDVSPRISGSYLQQTWRVLPIRRDGVTHWVEPSGVELARSGGPRLMPGQRRDYVLHPADGVVVSERYL